MKSGVQVNVRQVSNVYTYASIDIETLGLDENKHKIIEVGVVLDNHLHRIDYSTINDYVKELPYYHCYIRYDSYDGSVKALKMNEDIIKHIQDEASENIINEDQLAAELDMFFRTNLIIDVNAKQPKIMAAGKNFAGFDKQFLKRVPNVKQVLDEWFIHRTLDPAMYFFNPNVDDKLPNLKQCLERANFKDVVNHRALEDAYDVIRCLRYNWDFKPIITR